MKIALAGASGIVGRLIARAALDAGHQVTTLGRQPLEFFGKGIGFQPWTLGQTPDLTGQDVLVHAAFRHQPGRYRGGEGDDPAGFRRANLDGSIRLLEAAADTGLSQAIFLSSRAVFDGYPAGTRLSETLPVAPDSLYGEVKCAVEEALAAMASPQFRTVSLRATGVYGRAPGALTHKWTPLFAAFLRGETVPPRIATEVHGDDLARAVLHLLSANGRGEEKGPDAAPDEGDGLTGARLAGHVTGRPPAQVGGRSPAPIIPPAVHVSDLILDQHDLLSRVARLAGLTDPPNLPDRSPPDLVSVLDCAALHRLGWSGGGLSLLDRTLPRLLPSRGDEAPCQG